MNSYWCGMAIPPIFPQEQFVSAYQASFRGYPYNESYTYEQVVEGVLKPHFEKGMVHYVTDEDRNLIGFGCALPYQESPDDVKAFLGGLEASGDLPAEFAYQNAWYMSELGVLEEYRGRGVAWELVRQRMLSMSHRGVKQFFMRTAAMGSNSLPMYLKLGAQRIDPIQDVSDTDQATENHTQSLQRIYLWGDCLEAARAIERIKKDRGYDGFSDAL